MLTAADVMTREVVSVEPDTSVRDVAELLYTRRISGVPVVEHDRVIGIVSEGDLIGHAAAIGEPRRSWWSACSQTRACRLETTPRRMAAPRETS
jgi:CBS-domain-containing membrane protein